MAVALEFYLKVSLSLPLRNLPADLHLYNYRLENDDKCGMESLVQQLTQRLSSDINAYYLRALTFKTPSYAFNSYRH